MRRTTDPWCAGRVLGPESIIMRPTSGSYGEIVTDKAIPLIAGGGCAAVTLRRWIQWLGDLRRDEPLRAPMSPQRPQALLPLDAGGDPLPLASAHGL